LIEIAAITGGKKGLPHFGTTYFRGGTKKKKNIGQEAQEGAQRGS